MSSGGGISPRNGSAVKQCWITTPRAAGLSCLRKESVLSLFQTRRNHKSLGVQVRHPSDSSGTQEICCMEPIGKARSRTSILLQKPRALLRRSIGTICEPTHITQYLFLWREPVFRHGLPFLLMQPHLGFLLPYSEAVRPPAQCHGSILRNLKKACYISGFCCSDGACYTTITPFVKEL